MKQTILFITGYVLITFHAMAQSENNKDILTTDKKQTIINQELINIPMQPIGVDARTMHLDYLKTQNSTSSATISKSTLKISPQHYGNNGILPLYKGIFFYAKGEQKQYQNLASFNLAYVALGFKPNSKLKLTGGLLAVKQFTNHLPYGTDRSGARFSINYAITNQLDLNTWGQYLTDSPMSPTISNLLPQTSSGASLVLNFGKGSQFGISTEYQYDKKKEKWNYQSGGKLNLKF